MPRRTNPLSLPADIPDEAAMRAWLASVGSEVAERETSAAQYLIYDAWDADSPRASHSLALEALARSPLCGDAYNELTEHMPQHALELFARGMAAAELALGPERFAEYEGAFWGHLETRPYMRARAGLARELVREGRIDEAMAHWRELLRLCPNDNLGIRYLLLFELLRRGDRKGLRALLREHGDDESAAMQYTRALLAFTAGNKGAQAHALAAFDANEYVPGLLAATTSLTPIEADMMGVGGMDEAVYYVHRAGDAWRRTAGAVAWLARVCDTPLRAARMVKARARLGVPLEDQ